MRVFSIRPLRSLAFLAAALPCALSAAAADDPDAPPPVIAPVTETDPAVLIPPEAIAESDVFTIAAVPSRMTFSTMTGLPPRTKETGGLWASWGEGVVASNGKYYVGIGDHRGIDGTCYLYEYDPATHQHRRVVDVAAVLGQKPGDWGHGKLHGRLDETRDGWIHFATYWGEHPDRLPADERAKIGGRLLRYNVHDGRVEDLGMPLPGDSFPMHATDTRRGIFHAVGLYGGYLAWDTVRKRALFAGALPEGITWDLRSTLIDPATGICYGSATNTHHIIAYDAGRNAFFTTSARIPDHPQPGVEKKPYIRSTTRRHLPDGSFLCQTYDGLMFKFFPDEQRTERIGLNWVEGLYSTSIALSPGGQYVYYAVGAHGQTWQYGCPIIQMDTRTYAKKVLAFLHPWYLERHGYTFGGTYSLCIDPGGTTLLMFWNGRFREKQEGDSFGHPAFLCLEIPAEERVETPRR